MELSETGCRAFPLPMLPAVRNWAVPSRPGSSFLCWVVYRFSFRLTESPIKTASSKYESSARADSGSAVSETDAEAETAPPPEEAVSDASEEEGASAEEAGAEASCSEEAGGSSPEEAGWEEAEEEACAAEEAASGWDRWPQALNSRSDASSSAITFFFIGIFLSFAHR